MFRKGTKSYLCNVLFFRLSLSLFQKNKKKKSLSDRKIKLAQIFFDFYYLNNISISFRQLNYELNYELFEKI